MSVSIRDTKVFSVIVCPECGCEDSAVNNIGNFAECPDCKMYFRLLSADPKHNIKIIYASKQKNFSLASYHWKAVFITHSLPPEWLARGMMRAHKKKAKINQRMADKWDAHLVAVALKQGRAA